MPEVRKDAPGPGDVHVDGTDWKKPKRLVRGPGAEAIAKSAPMPLYVHRDLVNAADLVKWAKAQGFATTVPADDMHVTVTYSKAPVDWMAMGESWSGDDKGHITVQPGGPRVVSRFDGGAVVLEFACDTCSWRNRDMRERGASYDWPDYKPHVTISFKADEVDLDKVEPYLGKLVFGPEIFEGIVDSWKDTIMEKAGGFDTFCKVASVDAGLGLVFGWGIVCTEGGRPYVDVHKNEIPDAAMLEATTEFMKVYRDAGDMHVETGRGVLVHSFPLTAEIAKAYGITCNRTGWMMAMAPDPALLAKFASGEYTGFSIGGEHIEIDGVAVAA